MADDADHVVLELPRGENEVLRVSRRMYEGKPFSDIRVYFRGKDGELHPTRKGCSVRDREIAQVAAALGRIAAKIGAQPAREERRSPSRQRELPSTGKTGTLLPPISDEQEREVREAF